MTSTDSASGLSALMHSLQSWAHSAAPAGSASFEAVAWLSLAWYGCFAVVALHYALRPWAEKAMGASIAAGTLASLVLHLSLRHTPSYVGEGPLWKFVALSQYLPWAVACVSGVYAVYRIAVVLRAARH